MIKTMAPFAGVGVPIARLAEVHSRGLDRNWMRKRAAVLTKELADIRPDKGHTYIHAISMGCMEAYGSNRNGDGFNEKSAKFEFPEPEAGRAKWKTLDGGLLQYHPTFSKYAKVYKDHVNKDPERSSGEIVAEAYNPEMRRGELLIKVQNDKWAPELEKMSRDEDVPFSMSCKVPYDICSACGHEAANRREYCDHLKNEMTQVKKSGHQVFAINDRPMFFDYSGVFKPADRIAYGLRKVASSGEMPEEFIPSAQLAELLGVSAPMSVLWDSSPRPVQEKLAAMRRLAAMEKQIEATGHALGPKLDTGVATGSASERQLKQLRGVDVNDLLGALSKAGVCLPIRDMFRLVLGNKYDSVAGEMDVAASILPGIYSRMLKSGSGVEDVTGMKTYDPGTSLVPKSVRDVIGSMSPEMSVDEDPVRQRMQLTILRGGESKAAHVKQADGTSKAAQYLAKQYVAYQLAFSRTQGGVDGDPVVEGLVVRRNYAQ